MRVRLVPRFFLALLIGAVGAPALPAAVPATRSDADSFLRKLAIINLNSGAPESPRQTPITERELNAFLALEAGDRIPTGVVEPTVRIVGDGRVEGRAIVDLDAIRQQRSSGGWLDPLSYVGGRVPVLARGILHTKAGVGRLEVEAVELSGVGMPVTVLDELVAFYSRTPEQPSGIRLADPFDLPAGIREIRIAAGEAIVVQ